MAAGIEQIFLLESNGFTVEVAVTEIYEVLSNASDVTVGLRIKSKYKRGIQYLSGTLKVDGKLLVDMDSTISTHHVAIEAYDTWYPVARSSSAYASSPWTLANITHNTDGSRSVKLELEMRGYGGDNYLSLRVAATKDIPLTHIPRASTAGASDANIGAVSTVSIIRRSADYHHSVAYRFGALTGYLNADGSVSAQEVKMTQTSIPFRVPESFYGQIPNSSTGTCVLTVRTYSGNARIGDDQTAGFLVTAAKDLCAPQLSGSVADTNDKTIALTGDSNILVRYVSNALCTLTATARNSASIASKEIARVKISGNTLQLDAVQTGTVAFSCTDTRGYSAAASVRKTLVPYIHLSAGVTAGRKDPTSGRAWLKVTGNWYHGSFGAADNTLSVRYTVNGGAVLTMNTTADGNTYKAEAELTGLDYQKSHTITVTVTDKLQTVTKSVSVGKGIPVFDWGEENFRFHVPVELVSGCDILKNGAIAYAPYGAAGNPYNLLDNSNFRNIINQREFVSGTIGSANYTIDRWWMQYDTYLFLHSNCIGISGHWTVEQPVGTKLYEGKTYTFGIEARGNNSEQLFLAIGDSPSQLVSKYFPNISGDWKKYFVSVTLNRDYDVGEIRVKMGVQSMTEQTTQIFVQNAFMYEGEYTAENLPEYQSKSYAEEMTACKQYDPITGNYIGIASAGQTITTDCNDATSNGWYYVSGAANAAHATDHAMLVVGYGKTALTQIAFLGNAFSANNYIAIRKRFASAWNAWEWINPAMSVGVEYRTTERYEGAPVYTQLFDLGAITAAQGITVSIPGITRIIRAVPNLNNGEVCTPWDEYSGASPNNKFYFQPGINGRSGVVFYVYCGTYREGKNLKAQIWYTKD